MTPLPVTEPPLRVRVRVRPGARRTAVGGRWDGPGGPALVVTVAAPAVDGRANAAVGAALAEAFGVRPARVTVVSGQRGRDKVIAIDRPPPDAAERLRRLLG